MKEQAVQEDNKLAIADEIRGQNERKMEELERAQTQLKKKKGSRLAQAQLALTQANKELEREKGLHEKTVHLLTQAGEVTKREHEEKKKLAEEKEKLAEEKNELVRSKD